MLATDLLVRLSSPLPPVLIHVLPEDAYAEARIPGSLNICVYETSFREKVAEAIPDKSTPIVVYSLDGLTSEAAVAVAALQSSGYATVAALDGGLESWKADGGPCEGTGSLPGASPDGQYRLDKSQSLIRWTGRNLFNFHHGTVLLSSGEATIRQGVLESAKFSVDLQSVKCADLTDSALNAMLLAHLASADFLDSVRFPVAEFSVGAVSSVDGATPGTSNFLVSGTFRLRDKVVPVSFPALIAAAPDGSISAQAEFSIDRTLWGSIYGSGRFFSRLAGHVVNDHIGLHVKLCLVPEG